MELNLKQCSLLPQPADFDNPFSLEGWLRLATSVTMLLPTDATTVSSPADLILINMEFDQAWSEHFLKPDRQ